MNKNVLALSICCAFVSACGNQPVETLANLPTVTVPPEPAIEIPRPDIATLQRSYEQALASNVDPQSRRQIRLRLADLEMERLEQQQAENPGVAVSYHDAVQHYEALAAESPGDDYILYRLARARALDGQQGPSLQALEKIAAAAPESPFIAEVLFRRGEAAFNRKDYAAATRDFQALLQQGDTPFTDNGRYMLGWSQFKSSRYDSSAQSFLQLLDELHGRAPFAELPAGQRRLAEDSLRGLALGFSYRGGAEAIESFPSRPYQHHLYRALGDWYGEKERYRESASTYLAYVENYPQSPEAPALHLRAIETLQNAGLSAEVLPAKREFVRRYGIHSDYWQQSDADQRERLAGWLRPWLVELAKYDHARAQQLAAQKGNSGQSAATIARQSRAAYLAAAELYQEYADTFPEDQDTPEMVFLMAECLEQAGDDRGAWRAYSAVAWEYGDPEHGAEAGYAAILAADRMHKRTEGEQQTLWLDRKTEASLKFADTWPADNRALPVLLNAADNLFRQARYPEAIAAAQRAGEWQPPPDRHQRQQLHLLLGHSHFELQDYPQAELAYTAVLQESAPQESAHKTAQQRLQATIYRQAELAMAEGRKEEGLGHLLRIRDSGRTDIAATAQYDAINHLIDMGDWTRASAELADFRQHYPGHRLTPTLAAKAVVIFQALKLPGAAAGELLQLAQNDPDPEVRRQSLFMAAEEFRQAGETARAIAAYEQYSEQWRQPAEQRLEAQYQILQLQDSGHHRQRSPWLQSLAQNRVNSPRGRYLAAYAQSELAEQSYQSFARLPLRLPLKPSLANKKRAMETAVADYRKVLKFEIAEFTTQANFRLAEVYRQLSRDLMESQRPPDLNALELEQYEILLEEQAYPFEEKAIELHEANIQRTSDGLYDDWVKRSFDSLGKLLPARYAKSEKTLGWSNAVH